jgi:predicted Zn-dependent protease
MYLYKNQYVRVVFTILAAVVFTSGCVVQRNPVTGNKRAYGYTWEQEKQIGKEADPQIQAQYGMYTDAELSAYVDQIGQKVVAQSHLRRPDTPPEFAGLECYFRVLDSPVVNAFALPGGYIYVTRGLLAHLKNEAQLAVVLGHEVAHVAGRHASKRALQTQLGQLGLIGGAIVGQELLGLPGQDILSAGSSIAGLLFLRYGRDDERESDQLGVEYAALAGYKAEEAAGFFVTLRRLGEQSGHSIPSFMSTHPDPGEREVSIRNMATDWSARTPMTLVEERPYLNEVDGIVFGDDRRQGYVEGGTFYHPQLRFRFPVPDGFQVINQPSQVAMVGPDNQAIMVFTIASGETSASSAGQKLAGQEGVTIRDRGSTTVSGRPAYYVSGEAVNQNQTIRFLSYFIEYGDNVYQFVGYTTAANYASYEPSFRRSMTGFTSVSDPAVLNVQPQRLSVESVQQGGVFSSLVGSRLPRGTTVETLAILNQLQVTNTVPANAAVKFVK